MENDKYTHVFAKECSESGVTIGFKIEVTGYGDAPGERLGSSVKIEATPDEKSYYSYTFPTPSLLSVGKGPLGGEENRRQWEALLEYYLLGIPRSNLQIYDQYQFEASVLEEDECIALSFKTTSSDHQQVGYLEIVLIEDAGPLFKFVDLLDVSWHNTKTWISRAIDAENRLVEAEQRADAAVNFKETFEHEMTVRAWKLINSKKKEIARLEGRSLHGNITSSSPIKRRLSESSSSSSGEDEDTPKKQSERAPEAEKSDVEGGESSEASTPDNLDTDDELEVKHEPPE